MLEDAYISTQGIDFLDLRIITNSSIPVEITINNQNPVNINSSSKLKGNYFFRQKLEKLKSGTNYSLKISQNNEIALQAATLIPPPGNHIMKIGILADLHLNDFGNSTWRFDSRKRLYDKAEELARKYIKRLAELGADYIVLPGDSADPGTDTTFKLMKNILSASQVPCLPIIGNHETWSGKTVADFYRLFDLPAEGFYSFEKDNIRFLMLASDELDSLNSETEQFKWLKNELDTYGHNKNIFIFSHFSLILHPCVQGWKNDGLQQFDNYRAVLSLIRKYSGVRAFIAGHKNVPSRVEVEGITHLLCPQLIQAPCGFNIIDFYEDGWMNTTYEIDEQDYVFSSRSAFGNEGWQERFGIEDSRNFSVNY